MVSETFFEYIANGVHVWLNENNIKRPILLFVDGHKSHMTMELSKFCQENDIILYALKPNTTHIMQPADVSVFKPLKTEWKKTVREWQMEPENNNKIVSKSTFPTLLEMVLTKMDLVDTIKNGFRKCGLYPFNPDNVDYKKCVRNQLETLTECDQPLTECDQSYRECDINKAISIIRHIKLSLIKRGIDPEVIVEEINMLKNRKHVEILDDIVIQSGTYIINNEDF